MHRVPWASYAAGRYCPKATPSFGRKSNLIGSSLKSERRKWWWKRRERRRKKVRKNGRRVKKGQTTRRTSSRIKSWLISRGSWTSQAVLGVEHPARENRVRVCSFYAESK